MYGFDLSTKIKLSVMHYPSYRLLKFGQIEQESVRGPSSLIGPVVSEEKMFENVDGRTDGRTYKYFAPYLSDAY